MSCAACIFWQPLDREQDEQSPCSKLPELGVRYYPPRAFSKLVTPRDFECSGFQDAERALKTEMQLEKWFPIREEFA